MDVSISTVAYPDMPLADQLRFMSQAGFRHVNLMAVDLWAFCVSPGTRIRDGLSAFSDLLECCDLSVDWIHLPYQTTDLLTADREARVVQQSAFCNLVSVAAKLGATSAVFHPFGQAHMYFFGDVRQAGRQMVSFLEPIADTAEELGVRLALENAQLTAANNGPLHQIIEILLGQLPSLCICLDRGHAEVSQEMGFYLPRYAQRVSALHVHDNLGFQDEHRFPGEGMIDWPGFIGQLTQSHYEGLLGLEVVAQNTTFADLSPADWFAEAYRRAHIVTDGKQPPGPRPGPHPYMQREYELKRSGQVFAVGTFRKDRLQEAPLRLELATGTDWDGKPFSEGTPLVSETGISAEKPFTLASRIDVTASSTLTLSCRIETEDLWGAESWESAAIIVLPVDHEGKMIAFSTLAIVTGTTSVDVNRSLRLNADLVAHVELWFRKMADTTGRCTFSDLRVTVRSDQG